VGGCGSLVAFQLPLLVKCGQACVEIIRNFGSRRSKVVYYYTETRRGGRTSFVLPRLAGQAQKYLMLD
jgi:hypothetical protein